MMQNSTAPLLLIAPLLRRETVDAVAQFQQRNGHCLRVTRLGIEELFDEIKYLPRKQYIDMGLPPQLRTLPDLLVADPKVTWAAMLEIKFRRRFDDETARELYAALTEQRQYWPQAWALIVIDESFVEGGRFHQDYIRLIGPQDLDKLIAPNPFGVAEAEHTRANRRWDALPMLTSLFYSAHTDDEQGLQLARQFWEGADFITDAIKELRRL